MSQYKGYMNFFDYFLAEYEESDQLYDIVNKVIQSEISNKTGKRVYATNINLEDSYAEYQLNDTSFSICGPFITKYNGDIFEFITNDALLNTEYSEDDFDVLFDDFEDELKNLDSMLDKYSLELMVDTSSFDSCSLDEFRKIIKAFKYDKYYINYDECSKTIFIKYFIENNLIKDVTDISDLL